MEDIEKITLSSCDYVLPFPHPGDWALNPQSCQLLGSLLRILRVENALEFGSGYSSSLIAYELERKHQGTLHSIDNSARWSKSAKNFAVKNHLSHRISFHVFQLSLKIYPKIAYVFYNIDNKLADLWPMYDFVVIDGPHHDVGRDGALYEIFSKLKVGGYFFVDDSRADHMRASIEKWAVSFPKSISITHLHGIGNGITIIKKTSQSNNEPLISAKQSLKLWIKALRNYIRLHRLKLND